MIRYLLALSLTPFACGFAGADEPDERPNVVLILTDDQGYGDLSCHGNTVLKTPNLDRLHAESVRLTDYHVDPTCSPTRAALYTGRYSTKTGVWHTIQGRSLMAPEEVTIAERLRDAGYRTGIVGKWHLGDNAPLRARDQGFDFAYTHGGGGVGQAPDYWGNDYFGDTYFWFSRSEKNPDGTEKLQSTDEYCTDEWFDAAEEFVARNAPAKTGRPFFLTVATNAPHGPYRVPEKWSQPYRDAGVKGDRANFYGMIANIDARLGAFRDRLEELGLAENTIFVFTTDNGTAAGHKDGGFNAGMRGNKGSEYDGGHRVPFFLHWPAGGFAEGRDVDRLTAHIDVMPTLLSLCNVPPSEDAAFDGRNLTPLLRGEDSEWPDRTLAVHSQRIEVPEKWRKSAVMTDRWRLVNREELYDVEADPGQKTDVAADHPQVVAELQRAYEQWWAELEPAFDDPFDEDLVRIDLGPGPVELCAHDWHQPENRPVPWSQAAIRNDPVSTGWWAVQAPRAGRYRITLRDRPAAAEEDGDWQGSCAVSFESRNSQTRGARTGSFDAPPVMIMSLPEGPAKLTATLTENDVTRGAYYVTVEEIEPLLTPDLSDVLPDD
ncbi:arylsulfatase [Alienimonas sp. DA493]|uniref:arylsulfatase n=1 Tax=Alienimonas sp. DA493 TaxID=3373605 RepID=UPI00375496EB